MTPARLVALRAALDAAAAAFDVEARLGADPLGIVRAHPREEREVVAHLAAALAYGAVGPMRVAIRDLLGALGTSPTDAVEGYRAGDFRRLRPGFVYRMTTADDIDAYLVALAAIWRRGGLGACFAAGDTGAGDVRAALTAYVAELRAATPAGAGRGARYLMPDPATGSATKRWNLLLRWLVRPDDGVDLGLWRSVGSERLVLPLDTHVARLVRYLGMTRRRTVDYRAAREATDVLARIDRADPLRFDMPLCHLGIAGQCRHRWDASVCPGCDLVEVCTLAVSRGRGTRA